jgi:hypothetical protein
MLQSARTATLSDRIGRPALALALAGMAATANPAWAQNPPANATLEFNIPSQALSAALNRYGDATGREALYDTSIAAGQVSSDVQGVFTLNEALEKLLSGTGLAARFVAEDSFVLLPPSPADRQAPDAPSPAQQRYYGLIQVNLLDALCRSSGARPGRYRFVAVFWIGPDGTVQKSQRLGSAGTADADREIDATLRSVKFNEPPPAGFEQPVLILLVPQAPGVTLGCEQAEFRLRPAGDGR